MPIRKVMKGMPMEHLAAEGIMRHDHDAIKPVQRECTTRTSMTIQLEQETYLSEHPEAIAMMELFISKIVQSVRMQVNVIQQAGKYFLRPLEELEEDIKKRLGVEKDQPYLKSDRRTFKIDDNTKLDKDLRSIIAMHCPSRTWSVPSPTMSSIPTKSSSFFSIRSSDTTLPTPEPIPTPEPTLSEILFGLIQNTINKAFFGHFDDSAVLYDCAYVAVAEAVEEAMEIPVIEIKEDIAELYYNAYRMFELDITEKERIAAEIAWGKRMRKKMKRTLRREMNFKGYEPAPSSGSTVSSHESYRHAPPKPCICHPQWHYNRLPKDRFGIYLPREQQYSVNNTTVSPVISTESSVHEEAENENEDAKSNTSKVSKPKTEVKIN